MSKADDAFMLEVVASYEAEVAKREVTYAGVQVLTLRGSGGKAGKDHPVPEGSVVAYVARRGSPVLRKVEAAAKKGDLAAIGKIHTAAGQAIVERLDPRHAKKARPVKSVPVLGELRYRSKTLARAVFPQGGASGVDIRVFPYNGGKLHDDDFRLAQFKSGTSAGDLEVVLLKRAPALSPLESKVLASVSGDATENNIAAELSFIGAIVNAVVNAGKKVIAATKKAVAWATDHKVGLLFAAQVITFVVSVFPKFARIGPGLGGAGRGVRRGASAQELLLARRQALLGLTPKS